MIPLSHITIKYTAGDLLQSPGTKRPYTGYYMETISGEYYSGTNNMALGEQLALIEGNSTKNPNPTRNVRRWNTLRKKLKIFLSNTHPVPTMKNYPTDNDYQAGQFQRYFSKRINNQLYQEIEEEVYNSINKRSLKYDHNLYEIGQITWHLTDNVYKKNALVLMQAELKYPNISHLFPLLNEFFKPSKSQENLYTEGGELYYADGTEYVGFYHIHSSEGPMVGAYHTENPHQRLYYTNQLPSPGGISYEEWLANQYTPYSRPSIPNKEDEGSPTGDIVNQSYNCNILWIPAGSDYGGITDEDGLIPGGTECIDPGDGTGTYTYAQYGPGALSTCKQICAEINLDPNALGIGCLYHWDPNYCSSCTQHHIEACATSLYYTFEAGCLCGTYTGDGQQYFGTSCCSENYDPNDDTNTGGSSGGSTGGGGSNPGGGSSCFIPDTLIIMSDGTTKRIDEIELKDIVKSEKESSKVIGIDIHKGTFTMYSINGGKAFVTSEHPFKTTNGWKAINPLETFKKHKIESTTLKIGDILITKEGTKEITSIEASPQTVNTVYNLKLNNEHVYYADGYLVHNTKEVADGREDGEPDDESL